jgi:TolB protein
MPPTRRTRACASLIAAVVALGCHGDTPWVVGPVSNPTQTLGIGEHGGGPPHDIVFYSKRDGDKEIYLTHADGGDPQRVTFSAGDDYFPDLSPNGKQVVFTSTRTGNPEIFIADRDGGNARNLSNHPADDDWARWSPDGRHIAFHSARDGNYELYLVTADGSELTRLTNFAGIDQWPEWSPNGKQVSFRRGTDVHVMDLDGSNLVNLTNLPATVDQMAAWSPNGKRLAFMSARDGYCSVFVMNADGSDPVNLTPKAPADAASTWCSRAPAWSRNGQEIYFMSYRPGTGGAGAAFNEIFVMNADGSGLRQLTSNAAEDGGPRER